MNHSKSTGYDLLRTIFFDIGMRLIKGRAFVYTYKAQEQRNKVDYIIQTSSVLTYR